MAITIYGIKNCDTMKKARAWLDANGVAATTAALDFPTLLVTASLLALAITLAGCGDDKKEAAAPQAAATATATAATSSLKVEDAARLFEFLEQIVRMNEAEVRNWEKGRRDLPSKS